MSTEPQSETLIDTTSSEGARAALFDLAINRSLSVARKMGMLNKVSVSEKDLEAWHQTTRFAYRIPLEDIVMCINTLPDVEGQYFWEGGVDGAWFVGKTSQP